MAALAVEGIPASATHTDVHSLVSQFCAVDRVITIFPEGGTGSALVLLPPTGGGDGSDGGDSATAVLAATAAELLDCYPLEGGMLEVAVCVDPQAWLQSRLADQLAPFGQQAAGSSGGNDSGDDSFDPLELLLGGGGSAAEAFNWPVPEEDKSGEEGGVWQAVTGPRSRSRGSEGSGRHTHNGSDAGDLPDWCSSGGGMGSRQGSPPLNECGIVVFNLPPQVAAQEVGDFLCRFGPLEECLKPAGARYVLVRFSTPQAAAAAKEALHQQVVEELRPGAVLTVQYRTNHTRVDRAQVQRQQQQGVQERQLGGGAKQPLPQGNNTGLVVHNLQPLVERQAVVQAFEPFGLLSKVIKRPGMRYAMVEFQTPEAAAAAVHGLHGRLMPTLNPERRVFLEYMRSKLCGYGADGSSGGYGGAGYSGSQGGSGYGGGRGGGMQRSDSQGTGMQRSGSQGAVSNGSGGGSYSGGYCGGQGDVIQRSDSQGQGGSMPHSSSQGGLSGSSSRVGSRGVADAAASWRR